jgi:hypothetical protein
LGEQTLLSEKTQEVNPIILAIESLLDEAYDAWQITQSCKSTFSTSEVDKFRIRYNLRIDDPGNLKPASKGTIYSALKMVAKQKGIGHFPKSVQCFNTRFTEVEDALKRKGITLEKTGKNPGNREQFLLARKPIDSEVNIEAA